MLKRHGTRLDIGTAEDVAELNAAEALLRASYKQASMGGSGSSGISTTATANRAHASGGMDMASYNARGAAPYTAMPGASVRSAAAAPGGVGSSSSGGGVAATPTAVYGGATTAAPPHVHLGHSAGRTGPAGGGVAAAPPTPSSAASTMSVHAQRALYRSGAGASDLMSPAGRTTAASTATGYASSSSGRTPGGGPAGAEAGSGRRGPAQPLFHSPRSDVEYEDGMPAEVVDVDEEEGSVEEDRGRPSMRRAPFAVPVPASAAAMGSTPYGGASVYARQRGPPVAPPRYPTAAMGSVGEDEEEEEERLPRPSRVSGRYQLPRSPTHGDPSAL